MSNEERIEREVERTLRALDGLPGPQANPFLATRIVALLEAEGTAGVRGASTRLRLASIALGIVVVLNILMAVRVLGSGTQPSDREQLVASLSAEFGSSEDGF